MRIPRKSLLVVLGLMLTGCTHQALERHEYVQGLMGVQVRLVVYSRSEDQGRAAAKAAFARVAELENVMSDYQRDSELSRLSARAGTGPVGVSEDLFRVLAYAQKVSRDSDGAFDVTIGPLVKLWRRARKTGKLPSQAEINEAKSRVGWRLMKLDLARRTVELLRSGMQLDLGGIGKGYAGDEAIATLRSHGVRSALFEAGGDIVVSDAPPQVKGWEVEMPSGDKVALRNEAISTSGDTAQYTDVDGRRYSHVVDPKTGLGLSEHFIATIIASRGITTDALSTTATILGPERATKLLNSYHVKRYVIGTTR